MSMKQEKPVMPFGYYDDNDNWISGREDKKGVSTQEITIQGIDFQAFTESRTVKFTIPVIEINQPNCCFTSDEIREWAIESKIPESHCSLAYEKAQEAFLKSLQLSAVYEYLKEHTTIAN